MLLVDSVGRYDKKRTSWTHLFEPRSETRWMKSNVMLSRNWLNANIYAPRNLEHSNITLSQLSVFPPWAKENGNGMKIASC